MADNQPCSCDHLLQVDGGEDGREDGGEVTDSVFLGTTGMVCELMC